MGGVVTQWLGPGARLAGVTLLRSCARHFTIIVLYYTQVYKRVPENVLRRKEGEGGGGEGVTLRWTSILSSRNI